MANIYISHSNNPYENIASEYAIFQKKEEALFLWANEPSVILGRNQNAIKEINKEKIERNSIFLVRRFTGGGCVYHDLGNLNFSFISKELQVEKWLDIIKKSLSTFGIVAEASGRNDLVVSGYKVSGSAYLQEDGWYLFHGTLMVDVNIDMLCEVLNPSPIKFEGKGISSIKSRVKNLSEFSDDITVSKLKCTIEKEYAKVHHASRKDMICDPLIKTQLMKSDWIYEPIDHSWIEIEKKIHNAVIQLHILVEEYIMKDVKVYTDSLDVELVDRIKRQLIDQSYHNLDNILERVL